MISSETTKTILMLNILWKIMIQPKNMSFISSMLHLKCSPLLANRLVLCFFSFARATIPSLVTCPFSILAFHWLQENQDVETHFQIALSSISHSLKSQIINKSYDQVAICFFNTVINNIFISMHASFSLYYISFSFLFIYFLHLRRGRRTIYKT